MRPAWRVQAGLELLADARSLEREAFAPTAGRGPARRGSLSFYALPFGFGVAYAIRSQHLSIVTHDPDAMVAVGAIATVAFERADPPGLGAHRVECV